MTIKGYPDEKKADAGRVRYVTVGRIGVDQCGADVRTWAWTLVVADAVEANSTTRVINASAHVARVGDLISITSGALAGYEVAVDSIATNAITLEHALPTAPVAAVTFNILRRKAQAVSSGGGVSTSEAGRSYADSARNDYSSTGVTTGAWVQLIAATAAVINALLIFDSSGQTMELGVGAAGFETRVMIVPPGGISGPVPLNIPIASRVSVRGVSGTAAGGEICMTGLQ